MNSKQGKSEKRAFSDGAYFVEFSLKLTMIVDRFRWQQTGGPGGTAESAETHISHNVTNFEFLYEPFYVAPDTVPQHDERFLGYGYTRNTQVSA